MKKGDDKDEEKREKPVVERQDDESYNTGEFHEDERNDKEKEIRSKQVKKGDHKDGEKREKSVVERKMTKMISLESFKKLKEVMKGRR